MTENIRNASDRSLRYRSPLVKVVEVNFRGVLCLSDPSLNGWENGSDSDDIDMEEN